MSQGVIGQTVSDQFHAAVIKELEDNDVLRCFNKNKQTRLKEVATEKSGNFF